MKHISRKRFLAVESLEAKQLLTALGFAIGTSDFHQPIGVFNSWQSSERTPTADRFSVRNNERFANTFNFEQKNDRSRDFLFFRIDERIDGDDGLNTANATIRLTDTNRRDYGGNVSYIDNNGSLVGDDVFDIAIAVNETHLRSGDTNGDGRADFAFSFPMADVDGVEDAGAVFLLESSDGLSTQEFAASWLTAADACQQPQENARFGSAVEFARGANDRYDSLAISSPYHLAKGETSSGVVCVIPGSSGGLILSKAMTILPSDLGVADGSVFGERIEFASAGPEEKTHLEISSRAEVSAAFSTATADLVCSCVDIAHTSVSDITETTLRLVSGVTFLLVLSNASRNSVASPPVAVANRPDQSSRKSASERKREKQESLETSLAGRTNASTAITKQERAAVPSIVTPQTYAKVYPHHNAEDRHAAVQMVPIRGTDRIAKALVLVGVSAPAFATFLAISRKHKQDAADTTDDEIWNLLCKERAEGEPGQSVDLLLIKYGEKIVGQLVKAQRIQFDDAYDALAEALLVAWDHYETIINADLEAKDRGTCKSVASGRELQRRGISHQPAAITYRRNKAKALIKRAVEQLGILREDLHSGCSKRFVS